MNALTRRVIAGLLGLLVAAAGAAAEEAPPEDGQVGARAAAPSGDLAAARYSQKGADSCIKCHDDPEVLVLFKTRHGRRTDERTPFGHGKLQCEACHGPGGGHSVRVRSGQKQPPIPYFGRHTASTAAGQNGMCLGCHERDMRHGWTGSSHQREGLSCVNCHRLHAAQDPVLGEATQPEVCFDCHRQQRAQTHLPYSHPVRQGQLACSGCHEAHGTMADFNLVKRTVNDTCYSCHAEKRGPFLWEHAPVAEDCTLCHRPHGSNQPALLTRRAPVLCQQCHSQQGHPVIPPNAGRLPGGNPSALLLGQGCVNCHSQVHGSNHPSGAKLMR